MSSWISQNCSILFELGESFRQTVHSVLYDDVPLKKLYIHIYTCVCVCVCVCDFSLKRNDNHR